MFQSLTPREYIKIDVANNYGSNLDKLSWDQRIRWFDQHEDQLREMVASAEEPALFYAGVLAWEDVQQGKPIGYMVSLDATSSGLQILAALTGDRLASQLCNVIDTGTREDAYTAIYQDMLGQVGGSEKIDRDMCKQAIMTSYYGSTAMPKRVFGEGRLLDTFYRTMQRRSPGAWELNEAFLAMWDPTALVHDWVMPDNFHVVVKVMGTIKETIHFLNRPYDVYRQENMPQEQGRSLSANCVHSVDGMIVRELTRRCDYDPVMVKNVRTYLSHPNLWDYAATTEDDHLVLTLWNHYQNSGYLSARILQHLKPENMGHVDPQAIWDLIDSLPEKPFKVVSIHDCFRVLPTYGDDLRRQYNLQLQLIAKSNLLSNLVSQIIGRRVQLGKLDPALHIEILDANYALS